MDFNATAMERVLGDIRRQRERLDAVEEFLARADEQTVELLQQALGSIGDSVVKGVEDSNIVNGVSAVPVESNESHRQSISEPERPRVARGALDAAVRDACDEIGSNISLFGVVKVLESHDFQFGPGDPKRAVSIKLGRLAAKGFLRVTEPASGRSPAIYAVTETEATESAHVAGATMARVVGPQALPTNRVENDGMVILNETPTETHRSGVG